MFGRLRQVCGKRLFLSEIFISLDVTHHRALFTNVLRASDLNLMKKKSCYNCDFNDPTRAQFCTCHDSVAVVTCAKLWPGQIIIFHTTVARINTKFVLWAHRVLVRCFSGVPVKIDGPDLIYNWPLDGHPSSGRDPILLVGHMECICMIRDIENTCS